MNRLGTIDLSIEKPVLFTGAGISYASSLPLAAELKNTLLELLCRKSTLIGRRQLKLSFAKWSAELGKIMLESMLEIVSKHLNEKDLSRLFLDGTPTHYHYAISEMLLSGKVSYVITTNFDNLIEIAYHDISSKKAKSKKLNVVYDESKRLQPKSPNLIKIHGCATAPHSLVFNLTHVGKGLAEWKKSMLSKLSANPFIFLGYSDRDKDITPILAQLSNKWLWLCHNSIDLQSQVPVDSFLHNLLAKENRYVIYEDANTVFLNYVNAACNSEIAQTTLRPSFNWSRVLEQILDSIDPVMLELTIADILYELLGDSEAAYNIYMKGGRNASYKKEEKVLFLLRQNYVYGNRWNATKLERNLKKVVKNYGPQIQTPQIQTLLKRQWALLFYRKSYQLSIDAENQYLEEQEILKDHGTTAEMALSKMNQAVILQKRGDYIKANVLYEEALRDMRNAGNILLLIKLLTNYGSLLGQRGKTELALQHYTEGLDLVVMVGDILWAARLKHNIGSVLRELGKPDEALTYLNEAKTTFTEYKDQYWLNNVEKELSYLNKDKS